MSSAHPIDEPVQAALWARMVMLVEALVALFAPAGGGHIPVLLPLWRRARASLRLSEGLLRRLLLARAEVLAATLPLAGLRAPSRTGLPGPLNDAQAIPRFRLHEKGLGAQDGPHSSGGQPSTDRSKARLSRADPYGLATASLAPEMVRLAALVATVSDPTRAILRLARILRRRARRAANRRPFDGDKPFRTLAPPGLDTGLLRYGPPLEWEAVLLSVPEPPPHPPGAGAGDDCADVGSLVPQGANGLLVHAVIAHDGNVDIHP